MTKDQRVYELQAFVCQALASPVRLQVLYALAERPMAAGELATRLDISPPNLSQQLAQLKRAGLVDSRKESQTVIYTLASPLVIQVCRAIRSAVAEQLAKQTDLLQLIQ